jgi:hypothetical protein
LTLGNTLNKCNKDGTDYESQSCGSQTCNALKGLCTACLVGERKCVGTKPLQCLDDVQGFKELVCPPTQPFCFDGRCAECVEARQCPLRACKVALCSTAGDCQYVDALATENQACTTPAGGPGSCSSGRCNP